MVKALKTALTTATAFISAHPGYTLALWVLSVLTALAV
jgi:hypothetical protein